MSSGRPRPFCTFQHARGYNRGRMSNWSTRLGLTRTAFLVSARAALAAIISLLLALALRVSGEFYWAPISTIVIVLSTVNPRTLAWQRLVGTAVGAFLAAVIAQYPHQNWFVYGAGIFICGLISFVLRLGAAYRFAAIALTIVLLVPHQSSAWTVALHRSIQVSLGIAVALLVTSLWRLPAAGQS